MTSRRARFPRLLALAAVTAAPVLLTAWSAGAALVVASVRIESEVGARFCIGQANQVHVEVERRGKTPPEPPVRVYLQKWVEHKVGGGGTSLEIPPTQLESARMSVRFDGVRIQRADSAKGYFEVYVVERPLSRAGKTFRFEIAPSTDWSVECGRPG